MTFLTLSCGGISMTAVSGLTVLYDSVAACGAVWSWHAPLFWLPSFRAHPISGRTIDVSSLTWAALQQC